MAKQKGQQASLLIHTDPNDLTVTVKLPCTSKKVNKNRSQIDVTDDSSASKEYLAGVSEKSFDLSGWVNEGDAGFDALRTAEGTSSGEILASLIFSATMKEEGKFVITNFSYDASMDNGITWSATLSYTGVLA